MDKFGIFNLLNSFFPLTTQKKQGEENIGQNSGDILSSLFSSFVKSPATNNNQENKTQSTVASPPHPLQEQMLLTVSNHDAFVKRVKESQKSI